jgi:DNA-binding LacI/PurR family transcriptional regulator
MDAIFVGNDQMALSVLQTANEEGMSIPENLAVVGFDGIPESEYFSPALTTVFQNQHELGTIAVQELARQVEEWNLENRMVEPNYQPIYPELIVRNSTVPSTEERR